MAVARSSNLRPAPVVPILFEAMDASASVIVKGNARFVKGSFVKDNAAKARSKATR